MNYGITSISGDCANSLIKIIVYLRNNYAKRRLGNSDGCNKIYKCNTEAESF